MSLPDPNKLRQRILRSGTRTLRQTISDLSVTTPEGEVEVPKHRWHELSDVLSRVDDLIEILVRQQELHTQLLSTIAGRPSPVIEPPLPMVASLNLLEILTALRNTDIAQRFGWFYWSYVAPGATVISTGTVPTDQVAVVLAARCAFEPDHTLVIVGQTDDRTFLFDADAYMPAYYEIANFYSMGAVGAAKTNYRVTVINKSAVDTAYFAGWFSGLYMPKEAWSAITDKYLSFINDKIAPGIRSPVV